MSINHYPLALSTFDPDIRIKIISNFDVEDPPKDRKLPICFDFYPSTRFHSNSKRDPERSFPRRNLACGRGMEFNRDYIYNKERMERNGSVCSLSCL